MPKVLHPNMLRSEACVSCHIHVRFFLFISHRPALAVAYALALFCLLVLHIDENLMLKMDRRATTRFSNTNTENLKTEVLVRKLAKLPTTNEHYLLVRPKAVTEIPHNS